MLVKSIWHSTPDDSSAATLFTRCEQVLPTGEMHLVLRLDGPALRLYDATAQMWRTLSSQALVGGARSAGYLRDVSQPVRSVGAQLSPGAAALLLGESAARLAHAHAPLQAFWGSRTGEAIERLQACESPAACLQLFEQLLVERLLCPVSHTSESARHVVAHAALQLARGHGVAEVARCSGYSARHFAACFEEFSGLRPKQFSRLARFQRLLGLAHGDGAADWSQCALTAGYADQAHMAREFRSFAALTPGQWQASVGNSPNHVPLVRWRHPSQVNFVQDERSQAT